MKETPGLLDVVALREDVAEERLVRGQVGTVVEDLGQEAYLIEFSDREGRTYAMVELSGTQLMVLRYDPVVA